MDTEKHVSTPAPSSPLGFDGQSLERTADQVRAEQTQAILELTGKMLAALSHGLTNRSAQTICDLMMPATDAVAVAITSTEKIMGYTGQNKDQYPIGGSIRTDATRQVITEGKMLVARSTSEIGSPQDAPRIDAAIITPLRRDGQIVGALIFYYPGAEFLTETQLAIGQGFGELLSSQLDATALDEQRRVATSLELKMLQSQINPHFLFNTINTIASFVRTDPQQARDMLREFATFYRRNLEDSSDLISLSREVDQTQRYFSFEVARFGSDRLQFSSDIPENLAEYLVPAFLVQPLVENAVRHGMPSDGALHVHISARREKDALIVTISDDGIGMDTEAVKMIEAPPTGDEQGLGLAMRNINDRISGYYGPDSRMNVTSHPGQGTTVELYLHNACRID